MADLHKFANPNRFVRIARAVLPWSNIVTALLLISGLYLALFNSPADYQHGQSVRIMYVHVPSAWMSMSIYSFLFVASLVALIWRHPLAHLAARAAAPIGAGFTLVTLVTGSLWGKPGWGTWWVWDARLTSVLVLFFLYLGHIALTHAHDNPERGAKAAAILAIVGFVNVPIIKYSVDWWNTLHQGASVIRADGPSIDGSMLTPLLLMSLAFTTYFVSVLLIRIQSEINARKIQALQLSQAAG